MDGGYRADGCGVMYNGVAGEVCIAWGNTTIWARHIATALNHWAKAESTKPTREDAIAFADTCCGKCTGPCYVDQMTGA